MAWRWLDPAVQVVKLQWNEEAPEQMPPGEGWEPITAPSKQGSYGHFHFERRWKRTDPERRGYCGKAGPLPE